MMNWPVDCTTRPMLGETKVTVKAEECLQCSSILTFVSWGRGSRDRYTRKITEGTITKCGSCYEDRRGGDA